MVKYSAVTLDRTFAALADPTRRALLAQLGSRQASSVSALAAPHAMSLPAIMKHLDVLEGAGLIAREKTGRTVSCRLTPSPMQAAIDWLTQHQRFWSETLDRLAAYVEEETCPQTPANRPASPSAATSKRRRRGSSPPGRTARN